MSDEKFRFTSQITTGNVITFCTILVMVAVQWGSTGVRMANAEERISKVEKDQHELNVQVQSVKERVIIIDERQQQQIKQQEEIRKILDQINNKIQKP